MVTQYGMSEKFGLMGLESQENQYLTGRTVLNCGDATEAEIDAYLKPYPIHDEAMAAQRFVLEQEPEQLYVESYDGKRLHACIFRQRMQKSRRNFARVKGGFLCRSFRLDVSCRRFPSRIG